MRGNGFGFMFWLIGILLGIVMLYFGSDWLVDGAKKLAIRLGIAPFVIGLTVLAFGSSAPEAVTSIVSTSTPEIIIGNVIGSNIANIGLCIGLAAILHPMVAKFTSMRFEMVTMVFAACLITIMGINGYIGFIEGIILMSLLVVIVFFRFLKSIFVNENVVRVVIEAVVAYAKVEALNPGADNGTVAAENCISV